MLLWSSLLISSIGRFVPLTFRPPAAFCCSAQSRKFGSWLVCAPGVHGPVRDIE
jgi:hypothetical protein